MSEEEYLRIPKSKWLEIEKRLEALQAAIERGPASPSPSPS